MNFRSQEDDTMQTINLANNMFVETLLEDKTLVRNLDIN